MVVVIPARNEEARIARCLESLAQQRVIPTTVVVVDDGSSDGTALVAASFSGRLPDLRVVRRPDRGTRSVGPGVIEAFYTGLNDVDIDSYDFVCKLDADVHLGPRYFDKLLAYFEADPQLAAASGKVINCEVYGLHFEEKIIDEQVSGAAKCYRVEVFKMIDGFVRAVMWDGIDMHRSRMLGFRTRSFRDPDLAIYHSRLMGSSDRNVYRGRLRWGRGQWFMGSAWWYVFLAAIFRMAERPWVIGGALIFYGYVTAAMRRERQYDFPGFRKHLHEWQRIRVLNVLRGRGANAVGSVSSPGS